MALRLRSNESLGARYAPPARLKCIGIRAGAASARRADGDALVVSTTFDTTLIEGHRFLDVVPMGGATRLVERFELSDDRRQLAYSWRIENPDYLAEPYGRTTSWAWRPDIEVPRLECDPSVARRFQDAF